ncbi:hypothetical protein M422DRAFT_774370 [Sphaerobolus stellatus SS14]|nr:hypothetical protein M422DRAFT_774370 [Sphaerobolus stellatus SS14]
MPKATSERFNRANKAAHSKDRDDTKSSGINPLFNTARFGQHILKNPSIAQRIVDAGNIKSTDHVLEVGPGTGNLTLLIINLSMDDLLEKAKRTVAVEMDPRMAAELVKRVQGTPEQRKLDIIIGDFVKVDLPYFNVCISNTPYQISSPLVFRILSHRPLCRVAILMFQREFAERLVAQPGTRLWSRLSANVQLYAKVDTVMHVSRKEFRPPPNVDSSVIRLVLIDPPPPVKFEEFDGLTRILFARPNKTIRANFQAKGVIELLEQNRRTWFAEQEIAFGHNIEVKETVEAILSSAGAENRASKMGINDILKLLSAFHDAGMHFS